MHRTAAHPSAVAARRCAARAADCRALRFREGRGRRETNWAGMGQATRTHLSSNWADGQGNNGDFDLNIFFTIFQKISA